VTQRRVYFKTGRPRHSPFLVESECGAVALG
jgi:hypothetical protein